ncbi:serine/threonine protein kinase [Streptomyces inusitatus]|uniref:non-specific serine/threonine protein kinase n=1 Tax=Streptomyces inusitatus TaxID=68221 RepID=A0A918UT69_9ACTN|nr:class III lanthionine synthetase LanKC [Streptomyces inusitatus]GGZ32170.1 serine/threonine protein kinase [Streptomyces inusitatus]
MDQRYDAYCMADPDFYDSPTELDEEDLDFTASGYPMPDGWTRHTQDIWLVYRPDGVTLPLQGWKIHVSASRDNADKVISAVWDYCTPLRIPFKYLRGQQIHHTQNMKYADRGSSGKLVTIYPVDETQFHEILQALEQRIGGEPGPYILSDLRWNAGPLYVRYGGFVERHVVSVKGTQEQAIEDPAGNLVPDRRDPAFYLPPWVTLPEFLKPHWEARNTAPLADLPYRVERVLHFSNGGGIYAGTDTRSGEQVILKEARPHAGLSTDGADAVARLARERKILEQLAGVASVPEVRGSFKLGEHHFLVEEFIEGRPLNKYFGERYPFNEPDPDPQEISDYVEWALKICRQVENAVAALHERDVIFGDLHPYNVLVRADDNVTLIDFEVATLVQEGLRPPLGNPAFAAPRDRTGFDIDRYALGCLRLFMFLPMTVLLRHGTGKARHLAREISRLFPQLPQKFLDVAVRDIEGNESAGEAGNASPAKSRADQRPRHTAPANEEHLARLPLLGVDPAAWELVRRSMADAILASATPDRDDRLFPGDIAQFRSGGLNLAHGAAGVLYALDVTGAGRFPEHEEWLANHAMRRDQRARLGFYDGLHGVAYTLDQLGHHSSALELLDLLLKEKWQSLGTDLLSGLSGIGLNLLHFARQTGSTTLRDTALRAAELVAGRLGGESDVGTISGGDHPHSGLLQGSSGPALFFVRLYEDTTDTAFLDLAETALRQDLRRCLTRESGALHVNEGWRSMPYLATGSAGVALALQAYLRHRTDERFTTAAEGVRRSSASSYYVQSGLFNGRAGIIAHAASISQFRSPGEDPEVRAHLQALSWHALSYQGHLAFPGDQLVRLSMDLATGSAGVLLALGAALHDSPASLPFLGPAWPYAARLAGADGAA